MAVFVGVVACSEGTLEVTPAPAAKGGAAATTHAGSAGAKAPAGGAGGTSNGGSAGNESHAGNTNAAGIGGSIDLGAGHAGSGGAGPIVRTVTQRNPFGNTDATNLLWDGDFEWAGQFAEQYLWTKLEDNQVAFEAPDVLLGATCHSGVKCASIAKGSALAGFAVSPTTATATVRVFVKPVDGGSCDEATVQFSACFVTGVFATKTIAPATMAPVASDGGYCRFEGTSDSLDSAGCVFVHAKGGTLVVDDAFVGAPTDAPPAMAVPEDPHFSALKRELSGFKHAPKPPKRGRLRAPLIR